LAGIVAAMLFVSAPYTVNAARIGFETVDPRLEQVARTLGLGPWRVFARVSLPLARRGIVTGLTLTFARAISEFAAVAILSYYPMTAPVKIYELFLQSGLDDAAGGALLLLIVSLGLFVLFRQLGRGASVGIGR
jgi:molybdate/tungstate transport system permease protein